MREATDSDAGRTASPDSTAPEGPAEPGSSAGQRWTVTSLALAHKRITAGSIVTVLALIAVTLITTVGDPSRQSLSDSATCTEWVAGTPAQKIRYSHLYINEYGQFANTARNASSVEALIDKACIHASYLGEADDITVLASIRHAF